MDLDCINSLEEWGKLWQKIAKRQIIKENARESIQNMDIHDAEQYIKNTYVLEDGIERAKDIEVEREDSVLEIGAGPGIVSFELAKKANHLTAIEPSKAFSKMFRERARIFGISNTTVITEFWEDWKPTKHYDVVVSSFSLITSDIVPFLQKMNDIATKRCYIHWFGQNCTLEKQNKEVSKILGKEYFELIPKMDIVFNILYCMNVFPNVKILPKTHFDRIYNSIDDALKAIKHMFAIKTDSYDEKLIEYIKNSYIYNDGKYIYPDVTKFASISWEK